MGWEGGGGLKRHRAHGKACVGVTLGSDDLINIPACKANLLHSEGCSCNGATHEGDIGECAGGVEAHPSTGHAQTHSNEDYTHAYARECRACMQMQHATILVIWHRHDKS